MGQAIQIDTPAYIRKLTEAGADERLAEAIAWCFNAIDTSQLATKTGLATLKIELMAEIRASSAELKSDILRWMFGAMAVQTALLVALLRVL